MKNKEPNITSLSTGDAFWVFLRIVALIFRIVFVTTFAVITTVTFVLIVLVLLIHDNPVQLPAWGKP